MKYKIGDVLVGKFEMGIVISTTTSQEAIHNSTGKVIGYDEVASYSLAPKGYLKEVDVIGTLTVNKGK